MWFLSTIWLWRFYIRNIHMVGKIKCDSWKLFRWCDLKLNLLKFSRRLWLKYVYTWRRISKRYIQKFRIKYWLCKITIFYKTLSRAFILKLSSCLQVVGRQRSLVAYQSLIRRRNTTLDSRQQCFLSNLYLVIYAVCLFICWHITLVRTCILCALIRMQRQNYKISFWSDYRLCNYVISVKIKQCIVLKSNALHVIWLV
jgi:hypothetical protein